MAIDTKRAAAAAAAGAVGGSLLALLLSKEVRAAPPGVDQQVWDMWLAMLEAQAELINSINTLIQTLGGAGVGPDPFANMPRFVTGQVLCTVVNQGFQLPSFPIPKNKQLVVKALQSNVGWIYVGATQADSQNLVVAYLLVPGEAIGLFVQDSDCIWVMAPAPPIGALNDGVNFLVEQE